MKSFSKLALTLTGVFCIQSAIADLTYCTNKEKQYGKEVTPDGNLELDIDFACDALAGFPAVAKEGVTREQLIQSIDASRNCRVETRNLLSDKNVHFSEILKVCNLEEVPAYLKEDGKNPENLVIICWRGMASVFYPSLDGSCDTTDKAMEIAMQLNEIQDKAETWEEAIARGQEYILSLP